MVGLWLHRTVQELGRESPRQDSLKSRCREAVLTPAPASVIWQSLWQKCWRKSYI